MDLSEEQIDYFWERVDKTGGPDTCWDWTAGCNDQGYGSVKYNRKNFKTHNVALRLEEGPPPPDKTFALHSCKQNRKCCNPDHLRWGDHDDNAKDRIRDGTSGKGELLEGVQGELHGRSKLTEAQVLEIREKYVPWKYSTYMLAAEFGVEKRTIADILKRKTWKHI